MKLKRPSLHLGRQLNPSMITKSIHTMTRSSMDVWHGNYTKSDLTCLFPFGPTPEYCMYAQWVSLLIEAEEKSTRSIWLGAKTL